MITAKGAGVMRRVAPAATTGLRHLHASASVQHGLIKYFNKHRKVTDPAKLDPGYFEKQAEKLPLDGHYIDALKMLWDDKIGSVRDLGLRGEDSLIATKEYGLPEVDLDQPRGPYRNVDILKTAPEPVRKMFSIGYGERRDLASEWKQQMVSSVRLHELDESSLQKKIAWATACIRHWTVLADDLMAKSPQRPRWLLHRMFLLINYRRRLLKQLRERDFPEFEQCLKTLKIAYHVQKEPEHVHTRKAWSEHQLLKRVHREKEARLSALHASFVEGREKRVQEIEQELDNLKAEEEKIVARLQEISELEGKSVRATVGTYQPKLIEEMSEYSMHHSLFYHPKPTMSAER